VHRKTADIIVEVNRRIIKPQMATNIGFFGELLFGSAARQETARSR
jgi:hypothetical protein